MGGASARQRSRSRTAIDSDEDDLSILGVKGPLPVSSPPPHTQVSSSPLQLLGNGQQQQPFMQGGQDA